MPFSCSSAFYQAIIYIVYAHAEQQALSRRMQRTVARCCPLFFFTRRICEKKAEIFYYKSIQAFPFLAFPSISRVHLRRSSTTALRQRLALLLLRSGESSAVAAGSKMVSTTTVNAASFSRRALSRSVCFAHNHVSVRSLNMFSSLSRSQRPRRSLACGRIRLVSSSAAATEIETAAAAPTSSSTSPSTSSSVPRANIVALLRSRGLLNDVAGEGAEEALSKVSTGVYCGFDPTASSLHVGNLLGIVVLSWFAAAGHAPIALLGGATGRVGDPSGRSTERPLLSDDEIEANVAGIKKILDELLGRAASGAFTSDALAEASPAHSVASSASPSSPTPSPRILNNLDWFGPITFLEFLRDVGKHARVGAMLSRDSVKSRMSGGGGDQGENSRNEGISFTEFAYQLLQGYDFVHLSRSEGVTVQIGGSDQMGNVVAGLDLIRRMNGSGKGENDTESASDDSSTSSSSVSRCYGITFPLLTKSDGSKMGKSAGGAVWLAAEKLSPFKFYQYLLSSMPDADVVKFLKILTFLPLGKIEEVEQAMAGKGPLGTAYRPNDAQRLLAAEVTRFVHGEEGLEQALKATAALHGGRGGSEGSSHPSSSSSSQLDADALEAVAGDAPTAAHPRASVLGAGVVDLLVDVGLQPSKGAARRLVAGGGVRLNNVKVDSPDRLLEEGDLVGGRLVLLASGKKNKLLLKVE